MLGVWMPLDGTAVNQGLLGDVTTVTAPTFVADGKTGKAMSSGAFSITADQADSFLNNNYFSFCCWVYNNVSAGTSGNRTLFGTAGMTAPNTRRYTVYIYPTYNQLHLSWQNYDSGDAKLTYVSGTDFIPAYTWTHIGVTYDGPKREVIIYKNGVQYHKISNAYQFTSPNYAYATNLISNNANQYVCDYRVFNHCLSAKEMKEASKGLIVHLKLNESLGLTNMVGDCGYNIYNNYGTGMTVATETLSETYKGEPIYRCTYTAKNDSCVSGFKSNYHSRGVNTTKSIYYSESGVSKQFVYWIYYRPHTSGLTAGGTASNIGGWTEIARQYMGDGWWRVGQSRTINSNGNRSSDYIFTSLYWPYAGINSSCTIDWGPDYLISGSTSIIENFVDGNNVAHDCSGFRNDGTAYNRPTPADVVARYDVSTWFSGNRYITLGRHGMVRDAITVSIWGYMSSWPSYTRMVSCTESGGWNFEPSNSRMQFSVGTGVSSCTYKTVQSTKTLTNLGSGWHHFVGTYDGLNVKIYIDGILEGTTAAYTEKTPIFYNASNGIFVAAEAGANQTTPAGSYYNGALSDFRIYASALSAEDVAELYHTKASIDNHGNFFCGELKEV